MQINDQNRFTQAAAAGGTRARSQAEIDQGLRAFMLGVYNNMVLGLAITGCGGTRHLHAGDDHGPGRKPGADVVRGSRLYEPAALGADAVAAGLHLLLLLQDRELAAAYGADDVPSPSRA